MTASLNDTFCNRNQFYASRSIPLLANPWPNKVAPSACTRVNECEHEREHQCNVTVKVKANESDCGRDCDRDCDCDCDVTIVNVLSM